MQILGANRLARTDSLRALGNEEREREAVGERCEESEGVVCDPHLTLLYLYRVTNFAITYLSTKWNRAYFSSKHIKLSSSFSPDCRYHRHQRGRPENFTLETITPGRFPVIGRVSSQFELAVI